MITNLLFIFLLTAISQSCRDPQLLREYVSGPVQDRNACDTRNSTFINAPDRTAARPGPYEIS